MFMLLSSCSNNVFSNAGSNVSRVVLRLFKGLGYQNLIPNYFKCFIDIGYLPVYCGNVLVTWIDLFNRYMAPQVRFEPTIFGHSIIGKQAC